MRRSVSGKSSKLKERKRKIFIFKIIVLVFFILSIFGSMVWLFHSARLDLSRTLVEGNVTVTSDQIRTMIDNSLSGSYFFVFPKSSTLLYPKEALEAGLLQAFPILSSATVESEQFSFLHVTLKERTPFALYCFNDTEPQSGDCFFVDRTGFIFEKAPSTGGSAYLQFMDASSSKPELGESIFPDSFDALSLFVAKLSTLHFLVKEVRRTPEQYTFFLEGGTRLFIALDSDLSEVFNNLNTLLTQSLYRKFGENALSKIDYIDLRFGNRVYYEVRR